MTLCPICGVMEDLHLEGFVAGQTAIAGGGGTLVAMARYRHEAQQMEAGAAEAEVLASGAWWLGYYHGRAYEQED